ncbi:aspartate--tRNA ligase [Candidatus Berkelbacteria bacterium]|nr:aspartate--tRNA ligase [Candidatus Berkelbacteria bacterium]
MNRITTNKVAQLVDQEIEINGWIHTRRDHGKITFFDLRDRWGLLQVVASDDTQGRVKDLRPEWVVKIKGKIVARPEKLINHNIPSGTVELQAIEVEVLNEAKTPPFEIDKDTSGVEEEVRLKYRYLDLRSERLTRNITLRSQFVQKARQFLFERNFSEIETPLLTKSTAEGSRDFVVPSRLQPGKFYALPQSPQQYKQLLMVAGLDRYFQIARAVRDEDLRADRGFEHTQIDIEMSFVKQEDILALIEAMMISVVESMGYTIKEKPFPRFTYAQAMEKFGDDKFDLRSEEDKKNGVLAYAWVIDFPFFEKTDDGGWTFTHNPFSQPLPAFLDDLKAGRNVENILTSQYDLICNGYEAGGGSIRAHDPEVLKSTYKVMGYNEQEIEDSVGHMLEAFSYGAPPHGGIALGVERNVMNLTGESYLREVQAFPMTSSGRTAIMDAPGELSTKLLKELGINTNKKGK